MRDGRIYLDSFWKEFAGDPSKINEATREHYAKLYAPARRHAFGFRSVSLHQAGCGGQHGAGTIAGIRAFLSSR